MHSPVCRPIANANVEALRRRLASAAAQRIARAGPSKRRDELGVVALDHAAAEPLAFPWPACSRKRRNAAIALELGVHDRGEHAIERRQHRRLDDEALDLVEHRILIADERQMIVARQLDEPRAGNPARDVAAFFDRSAAGRDGDG